MNQSASDPEPRHLPPSEGAGTTRRVIGFIALGLCAGLVVMLFVPGASEIAHALGKKCPRTRGGNYAQCHALDIIVVVVLASPVLLLIGLALIQSPLIVRRVDDDRARSWRRH